MTNDLNYSYFDGRQYGRLSVSCNGQHLHVGRCLLIDAGKGIRRLLLQRSFDAGASYDINEICLAVTSPSHYIALRESI